MDHSSLWEFWRQALTSREAAEVLGDILCETPYPEKILMHLFENNWLKDEMIIQAEDLAEMGRSLGRANGRIQLFRQGVIEHTEQWLKAIRIVLQAAEEEKQDAQCHSVGH